jgi:dihydroxyacid dehydratase/phosphogluconate dehydratase
MNTPLNATLANVTQRIVERSATTRAAYLATMAAQRKAGTQRQGMGCANMAHAFAALPANDKLAVRAAKVPHVGVVTAYNDMLSAHQPYEHYPEAIRAAARAAGATAQVAGGVPAMCDGITQGAAGMELSLFSRDVIALATAVSLSHNVFDAALMLGVCDKIVPGLLMGALQFGHLPTVFVPAGPMTSGLSNDEKAKVRQQYAKGEVSRDALLEAESQAYHSAGTCTFYGTANSNQMLMEIMGLHLPGSSFVNPGTPLRNALTTEAVRRAVVNTGLVDGSETGHAITLADVVTEKSIVNGMVGLLATGGSTNHTLHLVAMARAAGICIDWTDFAELSAAVPLLARVYPNGKADVNHFHAAGGMGFLMRELLSAGLLHGDVTTIMGHGLAAYTQEPWLDPAQSGAIGLARCTHAIGRRNRAAPRQPPLQRRRRPAPAARQPGTQRGEGVSRGPRTPRGARPSRGVCRPARPADRLPAWRAEPRLRGRGALSGATCQRHARAAQTHPPVGQPARPGLQGGAGDRWPHVGRLGQGARRHPPQPGGSGRRPHCAYPRWRHGAAGLRDRCADAGGGCRHPGQPPRHRARPEP